MPIAWRGTDSSALQSRWLIPAWDCHEDIRADSGSTPRCPTVAPRDSNRPNWHLHAQRRLSMCTDIDEEPIRRAEVNLIVESYGGPGLYGSSAGGYENGFLIIEATRCYHLGADLACILCAHACCERELAGTLKWQHPPTPNTERWGLGRLIRIGRERHWFDADLASRLDQLNENRRTLYHLQDFEAPTGLWRRAISRADNPVTKHDVAEAIPGTLRQDALEALNCAFAVRTIKVEREWS